LSGIFEWLISLDNLCKGQTPDFEDFAPLLGWRAQSYMFVSEDLGGNATHGALSNNNVIMILPNGEHGPKIEQQLYGGKLVTKIVIVKIGWIGSELQTFQKITFSKARIIELCQNIRYLTITARILGKESDFQDFSYDGKPKGHKVNSIDFSVGK
jgi:hypothetical protein